MLQESRVLVGPVRPLGAEKVRSKATEHPQLRLFRDWRSIGVPCSAFRPVLAFVLPSQETPLGRLDRFRRI